jgi:hypothetical protein
MYGGHGHRPFYVNEADRIETKHQADLPASKYSTEEVRAGFKELAITFGIQLTLDNLVEKTRCKADEILTWPVIKFHNTVKRFAWQAQVQRKYQEIMAPKPKKGR